MQGFLNGVRLDAALLQTARIRLHCAISSEAFPNGYQIIFCADISTITIKENLARVDISTIRLRELIKYLCPHLILFFILSSPYARCWM